MPIFVCLFLQLPTQITDLRQFIHTVLFIRRWNFCFLFLQQHGVVPINELDIWKVVRFEDEDLHGLIILNRCSNF
ncbi:hypothetical protein T4B_115 [Trichinella pseudospiralis]|uniref:Uncharacterized protein n=1 Tax=Trichinella pseudospiralis TaxID=6337 RepID=A0A0V1E1J8_TRIPS|nr:hypothetical protein T4A_573 [Trichinella pseudospiralis]KRZ22903.1 hypothetical protein T4B_115 [Trichinella pseudospiralis]